MLKLNITRSYAHPAGVERIHYLSSIEIPDDPVVVAMIVEAAAKAMRLYNQKQNGMDDDE